MIKTITICSTSPWLYLFYLLLGMGISLAHVPFSLYFMLFIIVPMVGWCALQSVSAFQAFIQGWLIGFGYCLIFMHWIVEPFLVEPEIFGWLAPFALIFLATAKGLTWAVVFWLAYWFRTHRWQHLLALAFLWTGMEYLRLFILTGFPWMILGHAWVNTPMAQLVSVVGSFGLTAITLILLFIPVAVSVQYFWRASLVSIVCFAILTGFGIWRLPAQISMHPDHIQVRLIQPNAPQHLKWQRDMIPIFFERSVTMTRKKSIKIPQNGQENIISSPDVVIWPETSLPFVLGENPSAMVYIGNTLAADAYLIAGIHRRDDIGIYNSLVVADAKGHTREIYDKHLLVPFGEYIPFQSMLEKLGIVQIRGLADKMSAGMRAGTGIQILQVAGLPKFLALICYEAIFTNYIKTAVERPEWIIHISNDAWFGDFSGPFQHLAHIQMRAIEQGLPIARSANTGISAMIGPYGSLMEAIELGHAGSSDVLLPAPLLPTIYVRWGESIWISLCLLALFFCTIVRLKFHWKFVK